MIEINVTLKVQASGYTSRSPVALETCRACKGRINQIHRWTSLVDRMPGCIRLHGFSRDDWGALSLPPNQGRCGPLARNYSTNRNCLSNIIGGYFEHRPASNRTACQPEDSFPPLISKVTGFPGTEVSLDCNLESNRPHCKPDCF